LIEEALKDLRLYNGDLVEWSLEVGH
jgi:hypothetical protein